LGGNRIEELKNIIDKIFLSLEKDDFEMLSLLEKRLNSIDLNSLKNEDKIYLNKALLEIEKKIADKKEKILRLIGDKENLKKFI